MCIVLLPPGVNPIAVDKYIMAAVTVYSAPEDGRKGRPKHVEHTCSF